MDSPVTKTHSEIVPDDRDRSTLAPIRIDVDGELVDLVPEYLAERKSEVAEMMALLAASDYERLRFLGHDLKGNGSSYGFPDLTRLGAELEAAARRTDPEAVTEEILQLADYLARVQWSVR